MTVKQKPQHTQKTEDQFMIVSKMIVNFKFHFEWTSMVSNGK